MINFGGRERPVDDEKRPDTGEETGEDEGSSANEGDEDHLKEDQKTTSR